MDVEKFIDCVKRYPVLYNTRHKDYKNLQIKQDIWESIAREMEIEDPDACDVLRMKWKGLKDGYTKYKKQLLGIGGFPKCYNNWIWGPHLEFLEQYSKPRKSMIEKMLKKRRANLALLSSSSSSQDVSNLKIELLPENNSAHTQTKGTSEPIKIRSDSTTTEDDEQNAQIPTPKKRQRKSDAMDHLFMSYAETFRRFSISTQAMIKIEMAKLFAEAEVQEYSINQINTTHVQSPPLALDVSVNVKSEYNI